MDGRTGSPRRIKIPPAGLSYFHTQVASEDRHREENAWPILSAEPCRATGHLALNAAISSLRRYGLSMSTTAASGSLVVRGVRLRIPGHGVSLPGAQHRG